MSHVHHRVTHVRPYHMQGGRIQVWLDPEVIILLPVVNAAALRLAYWALSCVRLTRAIFDGELSQLQLHLHTSRGAERSSSVEAPFSVNLVAQS
jgi:hypothetical protein